MFKENFKKGFKRFSDGTSVHGFTELYYSKTLFWRFLWILIIIGSIIVTSYQLCGAVENYVNQCSGTVILPATFDEIQYPPLKFCIGHWIYWINWDLLYERNFTKETILIGMSYLTNVYSSDYFNIAEAEENFVKKLNDNKISTIMDFFETFSRPYDNMLRTVNFNETEFVLLDLDYPYFCYVIYGDYIKDFFLQQKINAGMKRSNGNQNILNLQWDEISKPLQIDTSEYNSYMAEWIFKSTEEYYLLEQDNINCDFAKVRSNYSTIVPTNILIVDGYSKVSTKLVPQFDKYEFTIKSGVSRWKNTKLRKCMEGSAMFSSNNTCPTICYDKATYTLENKMYSFAEAIKQRQSTLPSRLSKNNIYFLNQTALSVNGQYTKKIQKKKMKKRQYTAESTVNNQPTTDSVLTSDEIYSNCITEFCSDVRGCDVWSFDVSVKTTSLNEVFKNVAYRACTSATISYPVSGDVLMIVEIDSKTWEDFVGNVGGLLGIWTGASIISIFQIFYLCCCADMKGHHVSLQQLHNNKNAVEEMKKEST